MSSPPGYLSYIPLAEELTTKITEVVPGPGPSNDLLRLHLSGLLILNYAATIENCIKICVRDFALRQHPVVSAMVDHHYSKLNSKITFDDIKDNVLKPLGSKYVNAFKDRLNKEEDYYMRRYRTSMKGTYSNLITWRHAYAHQGSFINSKSSPASFEEVASSLRVVRDVIRYFDDSLKI